MKSTSGRITKTNNQYKNLSLARRVRDTTTTFIKDYDVNHNGIFEESEIISLLRTIIEADETELKYVTSNMFRYDRDNDGVISGDELINFFLEVSWGEIAIQRLHRKGYYKNGSIRMIEEQEFFSTMRYILSFIKIEAGQEEVKALFKEIDTNSDSLISYNEYFSFLRTYFGSQSQASTEEKNKKPEKPQLPADLELGCRDRLRRLVLTQARLIFIGYNVRHNLRFSKEEVKGLVQDVLKVENTEEVIERLWMLREGYFGDFESLVGVLLLLQFAEFSLGRMHQEGNISTWQERKLGGEDFVKVVRTACGFMNVLPQKDFLHSLFVEISPEGKHISYKEYREAMCKMFGLEPRDIEILKVELIDPTSPPRRVITSIRKIYDRSPLIEILWKRLEDILRTHDRSGAGVGKHELNEVIPHLFRKLSPHQRDVLVWSASNWNDGSPLKSEQFAEWAFNKLFQYGSVSFLGSEGAPKSLRLDLTQFCHLMKEVYWFITPGDQQQLPKLFNSLATGEGKVDHASLQTWVKEKLSKKF